MPNNFAATGDLYEEVTLSWSPSTGILSTETGVTNFAPVISAETSTAVSSSDAKADWATIQSEQVTAVDTLSALAILVASALETGHVIESIGFVYAATAAEVAVGVDTNSSLAVEFIQITDILSAQDVVDTINAILAKISSWQGHTPSDHIGAPGAEGQTTQITGYITDIPVRVQTIRIRLDNGMTYRLSPDDVPQPLITAPPPLEAAALIEYEKAFVGQLPAADLGAKATRTADRTYFKSVDKEDKVDAGVVGIKTTPE